MFIDGCEGAGDAGDDDVAVGGVKLLFGGG